MRSGNGRRERRREQERRKMLPTIQQKNYYDMSREREREKEEERGKGRAYCMSGYRGGDQRKRDIKPNTFVLVLSLFHQKVMYDCPSLCLISPSSLNQIL